MLNKAGDDDSKKYLAELQGELSVSILCSYLISPHCEGQSVQAGRKERKKERNTEGKLTLARAEAKAAA